MPFLSPIGRKVLGFKYKARFEAMQRRELITLRSGDWIADCGDLDSVSALRRHQALASLY